jgi:membrane-associated protease RseP (regulator of RpoE activity)
MSSTPVETPRIAARELAARGVTWRELPLDYAQPRPRYWLHGILFALTFLSTLIVGAQMQSNFAHSLPLFSLEQDLYPLQWIWQQPSRLLLGLPFACTLLAILLAHELGHYLMCRRYGIEASLPYFLPFPSFIGTLGAFIRIRSRIRSRAELFDIGVAGPIAGFVVAIPVLIAGVLLSRVAPQVTHASDIQLGMPLVFYLCAPLLHVAGAHVASLGDVYWHPVAVAAWTGFLATALNLLPGGQLDGGHILYAVFPRAHKYASRGLIVALLVMSPFLWAGWLVWSVMLLGFGRRHPYVSVSPGLTRGRKLLAVGALAILVVSFMPAPLPGFALDVREAIGYAQQWLHRI